MGTGSAVSSRADPIPLFLYFLPVFYAYIYIFSFFILHLPRVSRFDQAHFAVILRQLLVFTTLHAPHSPPPSFPVSDPLSLGLASIGAFHNVRKTRWKY